MKICYSLVVGIGKKFIELEQYVDSCSLYGLSSLKFAFYIRFIYARE